MRRIGLFGCGAVLSGALGACSSNSPASATKAGDAAAPTTGANQVDAATDGDASEIDASRGDGGRVDAASTVSQHVLVTFTGTSSSEMVAVNVATRAVDGRISFSGFGITDARNPSSLFLLEQNADLVASLEPAKEWQIGSSWSTALTDVIDGGSLYSDPVQIVVATPAKAYVVRYDRNEVAVIDRTATADGGVPGASIDLSSFVQTGDSDGLVEMTAAAYVASTQRLYVVLANINQAQEAAFGTVVCSGEVSTLVAIDTQTDTVVSLGGAGPGGSIALTYYNPVSVAYDAAGDRLIVVGAGCSAKATGKGDAGLEAATLRGVEAVSLSTGKSTSLLELTASAFPAGFVALPTGFAYIDSTHAVLGFDQTGQAVYMWDPTSTKIGAVIPNAPDVFTYDGNGHLLGARVDTSATGVSSTSVVSVAIPGGASTTLATAVTSLAGASYAASADVWPHP